MPDTRKHRGPHPADRQLFRNQMWPMLQRAVEELSWLLTRDYPLDASLKLVGDRHRLTQRQRKAVMRSGCSDGALHCRSEKCVDGGDIAGETLYIDGFNVLTTIEAALSGGVILHGRDGCHRDLASMHGNYRKVEETRPALELIGKTLAELQVAECRWLLDRPVSNSGRLSQLVRELANERGWDWKTELLNDPDKRLSVTDDVVATADSVILDRCRRWFNLAREVIDSNVPAAMIIVFERNG